MPVWLGAERLGLSAPTAIGKEGTVERQKATKDGHYSVDGRGYFRVKAGDLLPPGAKMIDKPPVEKKVEKRAKPAAPENRALDNAPETESSGDASPDGDAPDAASDATAAAPAADARGAAGKSNKPAGGGPE